MLNVINDNYTNLTYTQYNVQIFFINYINAKYIINYLL